MALAGSQYLTSKHGSAEAENIPLLLVQQLHHQAQAMLGEHKQGSNVTVCV